MELNLLLFGGRGSSAGVTTASSMQDTYGKMATEKAKKKTNRGPIANSDERTSFIDKSNGEQRIGYFDRDGHLIVDGKYNPTVDSYIMPRNDTVRGLEHKSNTGTQIDTVVTHPSGTMGAFSDTEMREFCRSGFNSLTAVTSKGDTFTLQTTGRSVASGMMSNYIQAYNKEFYGQSVSLGIMQAGKVKDEDGNWHTVYTNVPTENLERKLAWRDAGVSRAMRKWLSAHAGDYGYKYTESSASQGK